MYKYLPILIVLWQKVITFTKKLIHLVALILWLTWRKSVQCFCCICSWNETCLYTWRSDARLQQREMCDLIFLYLLGVVFCPVGEPLSQGQGRGCVRLLSLPLWSFWRFSNKTLGEVVRRPFALLLVLVRFLMIVICSLICPDLKSPLPKRNCNRYLIYRFCLVRSVFRIL